MSTSKELYKIETEQAGYERITLINSPDEIDSRQLVSRIHLDRNRRTIATDFLLTDIVNASEITDSEGVLLGWAYPNLHLIDHHARDSRMRRQVSSTNLAIRYMQDRLADERGHQAIITHTDTDSILSSLILAGYITPNEEIFGKAALAADHTGEENMIADTLMALKDLRRVDLSATCLRRVLNHEELPAYAIPLVTERRASRKKAQEIVNREQYRIFPKGVIYIISDQTISGELLVPLFPYAQAVILASPLPVDNSLWEVRVRAGICFPEGASLLDADIEQLNWGGRWNGGNTRRKGGYEGQPEIFAERLSKYLESISRN